MSHTPRLPNAAPIALGAALLALALGCQTEVPYDTVANNDAGPQETSVEASSQPDSDVETADLFAGVESDPVSSQPTGDRYADTPDPTFEEAADPAPPASESAGSLPWETSGSAASQEQTAEESDSGAMPWESEAPTETDASSSDSADFLADLYEEPTDSSDAPEEEEPEEDLPELDFDLSSTKRAAEEEPAANSKALPWQSGSNSEGPTSEEAKRFFGGLSGSKPAATEETAEDTTPVAVAAEPTTESVAESEPNESGFGDFLEDAYEGIVDESAPRPRPREPEADSNAPLPFAPRPQPWAAAPPADTTGGLLSGMRTPRKKKPKPKKPSTTDESMPWDLAGEPSKPSKDTDALPWADAPPTPQPAVAKATPPLVAEIEPEDRYAVDELPAPVEAERVATRAPVLKRRVPDIEPLPPLPVQRANTRHIAWLLGGKLGLARLADSSGATRGEVNDWAIETVALADRLQIATPNTYGRGPVADRVLGLLDECARLAESVADAYGTDHAALVEISLKTNALLVLHSDRPELAAPVARAIAAAADRAGLPPYLWRETVEQLEGDPNGDEIRQTVMELHAGVEEYLR